MRTRRNHRALPPTRARLTRCKIAAASLILAGAAVCFVPLPGHAVGIQRVTWEAQASDYRHANVVRSAARASVCATDRQTDTTSRGGEFTYPTSRTIGPGEPYVSHPETFESRAGVREAVEVVAAADSATVAYLLDVGMTPTRWPGAPAPARAEDAIAAVYELAPRGPHAGGALTRFVEGGRAYLSSISPFVGPYTLPDPVIELDEDGKARITVAAPQSAAGTAMTGAAMTVRVAGARIVGTAEQTDPDALREGQERADLSAITIEATERAQVVELADLTEEVTVSVEATGLPAQTYEVWESPDLQDRFVAGAPTTLTARVQRSFAPTPSRAPSVPETKTPPPSPAVPTEEADAPSPPSSQPTQPQPTEPAPTLTPAAPQIRHAQPASTQPDQVPAGELARTGSSAQKAGGVALILAGLGIGALRGGPRNRSRACR